jgi:short-subunit dehydrogenase
LIARAEAEIGPIDILVNNAGIETVARFERDTPEAFDRVLAVNLHAPIALTLAVVPGMLRRGRGHVVNISSGAGKVGVPYASSYATSKHGLVGFTHSLRCEYQGQPVGFSVICPAFVTDTGMYARWEDGGIKAPKIVGRAKPEKVAEAVIKSILKNKAEIIVNTPPIRPLVVISNVFPGVTPAIMKACGYTKVFRRVADSPNVS